MAKFRGGGVLSSRKVDEIETIFSESQIAVEDCLRLSEFIFWQIDRTLISSCQAAGQEPSTAGKQDVISKMRNALYSFCIRAFILQLVHSMTHRNSKIKLGHTSSTALLGYIHHLHLTLKCRQNEEPVNELVLLCKECFDWLEPIWAEFEQDPNKNLVSINLTEAGAVGPAEDIMANLKESAEETVVGSKVDAANRNYRMAYGMAVGIEASVRVADGMKLYNACVYGMSSFKQELENQMQMRDFPFCCEDFVFSADWHGSEMSHDIINFALSTITLRYSLPENGGLFSPTHILGESEHVWFEDLAPALFATIRKICKVDSKQYLDSVARREFSFIEFTTNSKSGEVFFFSHDGKFLLKTISNEEAAVLLKMLPDYVNHLQHQTSFLMRICGLHRVCTGKSRKVRHFLVAISVFDCKQLGLHHQFDLKGSTAGRISGPTEQVKKDVNWINGRSTIWLPIDLKRLLASIVEEDGKFLAKQNVLDYSILIGIHDRRSPNKGVQCRSVKLLANILREKVLPLISKVRKMQRQNAEGGTPRRVDSNASQETGGALEDDGTGSGLGRTISDPTRLASWSVNAPGLIGDGEDGAAGARVGVGNAVGEPNGAKGLSDAETMVGKEGEAKEKVVVPRDISLEIEGAQLESVASKEGNTSPSLKDVESAVRRKVSRRESFQNQLLGELKALSEMTCAGVRAMSPEASPVAPKAWEPSKRYYDVQKPSSEISPVFSKKKEFEHSQAVKEIEALNDVASEKVRASLAGEYSPQVRAVNSPAVRPRRIPPASPMVSGRGRQQRIHSLRGGDSEGSPGCESPGGRPRPNPRRVSLSSEATPRIGAMSGTPWPGSMSGPASLPRRGSRQLDSDSTGFLFGQNEKEPQWKWEAPHGPISAPRTRNGGEQGRFIYLVGIIDFLTPWSNKKRLEFSINVLRGRRFTASCVPPFVYARRQQNFFTSKVLGLYTCAAAIRDSKIRGPPKDKLRPDAQDSFHY